MYKSILPGAIQSRVVSLLPAHRPQDVQLSYRRKILDEADQAQEREEAHLTASLSARKPRLVSHDGKCIWCKEEAVFADTAFCSAECDEDYHKYQREQRQRAGN